MRAKAKIGSEGLSMEASHITTGSVLDDLGFSADEALELKIKVEIWRALLAHIEEQRFRTEDLVRALKVHQPDVSNLLNGKIGRFSVGRLIQFAGRLHLKAEVKISAGQPSVSRKGREESSRSAANGLTSVEVERGATPA
jgi:predicted XRE-type DNA-binding protein